MKNPRYGLMAVKQPSLSEDQAFFRSMARTLTGSLGKDEAIRCATRHNWLDLLPLVVAANDAFCPETGC